MRSCKLRNTNLIEFEFFPWLSQKVSKQANLGNLNPVKFWSLILPVKGRKGRFGRDFTHFTKLLIDIGHLIHFFREVHTFRKISFF